ncbi:hypothetical protein BofuT4_uP066070.1 [Botrytis cinerea T4]|uniref:Uncharacterized protein n=1 Tax=Botryotinia fuckeliana (strain T4) TaxID=999810 RepID=G2XRT2_BOTF4|nr:hypothetical protein BofuT4_uP066070.1 [Botrytis cinerea T4]
MSKSLVLIPQSQPNNTKHLFTPLLLFTIDHNNITNQQAPVIYELQAEHPSIVIAFPPRNPTFGTSDYCR